MDLLLEKKVFYPSSLCEDDGFEDTIIENFKNTKWGRLDPENKKGFPVLIMAILLGMNLDYLLRKGHDPNGRSKFQNRPAILYAASMPVSMSSIMVENLLYHRADPNSQDSEQNTALSYAYFRGQIDTAKVLWKYGAKENYACSLSKKFTIFQVLKLEEESKLVLKKRWMDFMTSFEELRIKSKNAKGLCLLKKNIEDLYIQEKI